MKNEVAHAANEYHAVNLSGGKDSTALLLLMIEKGMPIDQVLTADTGMEFPEMYQHLARVDAYLYQQRGLHITTLRHPKGFEWLMFEEPKQKEASILRRKEAGLPLFGNGWPGVKVRWCTGQLKVHLVEKAIHEQKGARRALSYIGIAADEAKRCKDKVYPLVDWGITEADALKICYDHGFDFGGLYRISRRASCWCCPFQRIGELRKLRKHHPELWRRLLEMDRKALAQFGNTPPGKFRADWSVEELDRRFQWEEMQLTIFDDLDEANGNAKPIRPPPGKLAESGTNRQSTEGGFYGIGTILYCLWQ